MRTAIGSLRFTHLFGIALFALTACGGGGESPGARAPADVEPPIVYAAPQLSVVYPPPVSTALEQRLTVRGTAVNAASVAVNGVSAQTHGEAWTASVTVPMGTSNLDIVVSGLDGTTVRDSRVVSYDGPHFQTPYDLVYDARRDRLIVADEQLRSLFTVDIATGERRVFFESPDAPAPSYKFRLLKPLALDADRNAVLMLREDGRIDSIDLDTGAATRIVDGNEGYIIVQPRAMALDPATRNLYVADRSYCTLHQINVDTKEHRIASDFSSGGTDLHFRDIYWDSKRNDVVIAGTGRAGGAVIRVHMDSGFRTDLRLGTAKPDAMSYDPIADIAFVIDEPSVRIYDRANGAVSSRNEPGAADFARFTSVACKPGTTIAYIVDDYNDSIVAFDRADGSFTRIAGDRVGNGPAIGAREGDGVLEMIGDAAHSRTLVAVKYRERYKFIYPTWYYDTQYALLAVDSRTGKRSVLAADDSVLGRKIVVGARGSGPSLGRPASLAIDGVTDRVLVLNATDSAIVSIDPSTGNRTTIASIESPTSPTWKEMAVDDVARRAFVRTATQQLLEVDLDTGAITSTPHTIPDDVAEMAIVPGTDALYLNSSDLTRVRTIDVVSGATALILENPNAPAILDLHADAASGRIVALDSTGIATFHPATGVRTPLVTPAPDAFFPIEPERICIDGANGCLQVITSGTRTDMRGIFAIDPVNGSVVVASKE